MVDIREIAAKATDRVAKVTPSVIALAKLAKVKPADLVEAIMDRESVEDYRTSMVAYAVPAALEAAKVAEAEAKKKAEAK